VKTIDTFWSVDCLACEEKAKAADWLCKEDSDPSLIHEIKIRKTYY